MNNDDRDDIYMEYRSEEIKFINLPNIKKNYYRITNDGNVLLPNNKIMHPFISNSGYLRIQLATIDHKAKKFSIHRLVAMMFIPNDNPSVKTQVNHINGNRLNNHISNLEWVSQSENILHAYDHDLCSVKGENSHFSKSEYTDLIVGLIAMLLEKNVTTHDIIKGLCLVDNPENRSSLDYQKWRHYIKDLRGRNLRREILQHYNF